jgi:hypothetical protein
MYSVHPSRELNDLFAHKPYQGAAPDQAMFLFVGLDANYEPQIEQKAIFAKVREYHDDGVSFWRKYGVHHPFLLPEYSGDGQFYHRSFARIGFGPQHADLVSFIELLHLPTVGKSVLVTTDLDESHLKVLNSAIIEGRAAHIFVPGKVANLMRATGVFPWLPKAPQEKVETLGVLFRDHSKKVYSHLHFSTWGKSQQKKIQEAVAIRNLMPQDG